VSRSQGERRTPIIVEVEQSIGKLVQREPNIAKPIGQAFENVIQFAPTRDGVRGYKLIVRPTNLLVELDVRSPAQTAPLRVLMKNSADEKRVIANVRAKQERLFGCRASERDEYVMDVLLNTFAEAFGNLQLARARKRLKQRRDIIAQFPVADPALPQNVPGQNVKIKLRRDPQMPTMIQDRVNQPGMIENRIPRFDIAQKIDKRNLISWRTRERAHNEVEISRGKPRPTIRPNHRDFIMRNMRAYGKSDSYRRTIFVTTISEPCLLLRRLNSDGVARCRPLLLLRVFSRDVPDLPRDRN
jgi:hypothetical protein